MELFDAIVEYNAQASIDRVKSQKENPTPDTAIYIIITLGNPNTLSHFSFYYEGYIQTITRPQFEAGRDCWFLHTPVLAVLVQLVSESETGDITHNDVSKVRRIISKLVTKVTLL